MLATGGRALARLATRQDERRRRGRKEVTVESQEEAEGECQVSARATDVGIMLAPIASTAQEKSSRSSSCSNRHATRMPPRRGRAALIKSATAAASSLRCITPHALPRRIIRLATHHRWPRDRCRSLNGPPRSHVSPHSARAPLPPCTGFLWRLGEGGRTRKGDSSGADGEADVSELSFGFSFGILEVVSLFSQAVVSGVVRDSPHGCLY